MEQPRKQKEAIKPNLTPFLLSSSNPPDAPRPKTDKKPSERKRGAQPGHPPTNPPLLPPERLSAPATVCVPTTCGHCQAPLSGKDDCPDFHQVIELPPLLPEIREWQLHSLTCRHCGHTTSTSLPEAVPPNTFGPRLEAFIGLCTGAYHLSKRQAEELLSTAFDIPISLGSICNIEQRVSAAIAEPVAEAKRQVQQAKVANADENVVAATTPQGLVVGRRDNPLGRVRHLSSPRPS